MAADKMMPAGILKHDAALTDLFHNAQTIALTPEHLSKEMKDS
jgi:hypothetical protein